MQTLNLTRAVLLSASVLATACDEPECVNTSDCSLGLTCNDAGTCALAEDNGNGNGGGGGGGGGEGEGEGEAALPVQLVGSLTTFQPGDIGALGTAAQQPAGTVLVGLYEPGTRDEILFFNPVTGVLPTGNGPGEGVNLIGNPFVGGTACRFDHASVQRRYGVDDIDELWLACAAPPRLLQKRTADFENQILPAAGVGADFIVELGPDVLDTAVLARRLYAARGDDTLYVERRQQTDNSASVRALDTVPRFGAIAGLTLVATDNATAGHGDLVAVFDRAWPATSGPALVIIERQSQTTGNTTDWKVFKDANQNEHVLELPAATHAVRLGTIPDPRTLEIDATEYNTVNLEVYEPTAGKVEFGRYETAIANRQPFSSTTFNPIPLTRSALPLRTPPATDRILLLPTTDGAVLYVMTNQQIGWKVPLHRTSSDSRDNEVRFTTFLNADPAGLPIGMIAIPNSTTTAWIGLQVAGQVGKDQLLPAVFDQ